MSTSGENWHTEMASFVYSAIGEMYRCGRHTDIVINVEDRQFHCHKAVLAAVSPYFDAMFSCGMRESIDGVVNLQDISKEIFEKILTFIYTGDKIVTNDNAEELIKAGAIFQIKLLLDKCEDFLLEKVAADNCMMVWKLSKSYSCPRLLSKAWSLLMENFTDVCRSEEFTFLDCDDLIQIIKDDDLNVANEEVVCDAVFRWYMVDPSTRKEGTIQLFEHLRLPLLGSEYLLHEVEPLDIVLENSKCREIVKEAIQYQMLLARRADFNTPRVALRKYSPVEEVLLLIGGYNGINEKVFDVLGYSFVQARWYFLTPLPLTLGREFAVIVYGNDVFASGGSQKPDVLLRYRSENNDWYKCTSSAQGRRRHAMVSVGENIIVLGGYDDSVKDEKQRTLNSVEEYNIHSRTWRKAGELVQGVRSMSAAVLREKIFIFGGILQNDVETDSVQCYDTRLQTCSLISHLPSPCKLTKAVVCEKQVYVIGTDGSIVDMNEKGECALTHKMKYFNRRRFGALHRKGDIILIGGESGNAVNQKIMSLKPKKSFTEYTYNTTMPSRANFGSLIIVVQKKYLTRIYSNQTERQ
ncbi:hypothetical protein FSP39_000933 [Pinctada imbricata]|uniref:BTB domain-containing protein n=1 Tax=Pinctada imbricata TaxID=66713 RepID=A0AA89BLJ2_PINIB|nr:hypothetical protein FSP39_000933 [Pinctada imbricata]